MLRSVGGEQFVGCTEVVIGGSTVFNTQYTPNPTPLHVHICVYVVSGRVFQLILDETAVVALPQGEIPPH